MPYKTLLLCLLLNGCTTYNMIETHLYFGRLKPSGDIVTEASGIILEILD
ncbi:MAG: hypothetical protein QM528_03480 [Phycisphaerales bacterium]|nr:hypothetical protein [Phycisphaerales bacterium]